MNEKAVPKLRDLLTNQFSILVGGVLTDSIGWRYGFYFSAILDAVICALAFWGLPASIDSPTGAEGAADMTWAQKWQQLKNDIDWIGAIIISSSLAMMSYVFACVTFSFITLSGVYPG